METKSQEKQNPTPAFRRWGHLVLEKHFRVFSLICFALWIATLYLFLFRVTSGFMFYP